MPNHHDPQLSRFFRRDFPAQLGRGVVASIRDAARASIALLLLSLIATSSHAAVRRVWPDGFGAYPDIQAAWNAAQSGDVIELEDGIFSGPGNTDLDLSNEAVEIRSRSNSAGSCTIDFAYGRIAFSGGGAPSFKAITFLHANGCDAKKSTLAFADCAFEACAQITLAVGGTSYQFDRCAFRHGTGLLFGDVEGTIGFSECEFSDNAGTIASSVEMVFQNCAFTTNGAGSESAVIDCYYLFYPQATVLHGCRFLDNLAPPVAAFDAFVDVDHCVFAGNPSPALDFTVGFSGDVGLSVVSSTIADQFDGPAVRVRRAWDVLTLNLHFDHTIIAFTQGGPAFECIDLAPDNVPSLSCCSIYGNSAGDYTGCIAGQEGGDGNVSLDPRFCSRLDRNYELMDISPLLELADCGPIGALGEGCASVAVATEVPRGGAFLLASPNPSRGPVRMHLADAGAELFLHLRIYDAGGRLVRALESSPTGTPELLWDGRDELGREVPAGLYLLRAATTRGARSASLLRVR